MGLSSSLSERRAWYTPFRFNTSQPGRVDASNTLLALALVQFTGSRSS